MSEGTRPDIPYPGLRPFREDEEHLFFGRERQVDAMVDKLAATHFLAVVGTSGCGKSSLVNCGLRSALHRGWMPNVGTAWRIVQFRPGSKPIEALAQALAADGILYRDYSPKGFSLAAILESELRTSKLGLVASFEQARVESGVNLLIVVDQFEELFRYQWTSASTSEAMHGLDEDARAFVNLLLEVRNRPDLPIYLALTMRSDFLGDCAQLMGLPEAINRGQYLVPRMNRDERRLAIVGPAGVYGTEIDPALATQLVNDVGENPDQLSILQHALNRTWAIWERERSGPLTLAQYELAGTMTRALDQHAERAYAELTSARQQRICTIVMKALTDWGTDARGVRRPTSLGVLCALTEATSDEVVAVLAVFRKPSRSFVMPPIDEPLADDTPVDLSHESLMRVWKRLRVWGDEEARKVQMYRRLVDWGRRWETGEAELWRGPDLASATAWRVGESPTPAWAERIGTRDDYERAMRFLDASEAAQRDAAAAIEAQRRAQLRRARRWIAVFGATTLLLIVGLLAWLAAFHWEHDEQFGGYVMAFGVPKGLDAVDRDQIEHRATTYRITTRGRLGPVIRMAAVNGSGHLSAGRKANGFEMRSGDTANSEAQWEYVYSADGRVAYEVAMDRSGQRVRSIVYSPIDPKRPNERNAYLMGKTGSLTPQDGSCARFLRYEYSPEGYEIRTGFLDELGVLTAGADGVSIMQKSFDADGRQVRLTSLWRDSRPMNDKVGNAEMRTIYDERHRPVESASFDAAGAPIDLGDVPWQRTLRTFDKYGNVAEETFLNARGKPGEGPDGCSRSRYEYTERGLLRRQTCVDAQGEPSTAVRQKHASIVYEFDDEDRAVALRYLDRTGAPGDGPGGASLLKVVYDRSDNPTEIAYFGRDGKAMSVASGYHRRKTTFEGGREMRVEYLDTADRPAATTFGYSARDNKYDARGNLESTTFIGVDGKPVRVQDEQYAIVRSTFDGCGREVEQRYFDERQQPTQSIKGYAALHKAYDDDNNVIEESRLGWSGQLVQPAGEYARIARVYDRHRDVVDEQYFDADGKPWAGKDGYARVARRYDDHKQLTEVSYFDTKGRPFDGRTVAARTTYAAGPRGELMATSFDANGRRVRTVSTYLDSVVDGGESPTNEAYFGATGLPVAKADMVDYGPNGDVRHTRSFARAVRVFDDDKHLIEESYFGTDGKPGAKTETVWLDPDGAPTKIERAYARSTSRYDAAGDMVEQRYFDADGEPGAELATIRFDRGTAVASGIAVVRRNFRYDAQHHEIETANFGADGALALGDDGWARRVTGYDDGGRDVALAYFGTHDEPVIGRGQKFSRAVRTVDAAGNMLELRAFGVDGKPVETVSTDGHHCAHWIWRYDDKGAVTSLRCYDVAERLVAADGQAATAGRRARGAAR